MESYEDFLDLSMGSLKDYLALRGLSTTGRKVELVARAFSACELKLPIKVSQEQLLEDLQKELQNRLEKFGISDPQFSETVWVDDTTKWPPVDLGKVFSYILSNKEFDSDYIGKYKDQKAYSYWKSNFVDAILHSNNTDGKCVLKSKVTPSQRVRDEPREVWVALANDGTVLCGWCTCIAGTSATCNHIIAVLYKVEYAFANGYTDPSCTSVPCGWNVATRKDVQPGKIMDMRIRKDKRTLGREENTGIIIDEWKNFDPRKEGQRMITDQQKQGFLDGYKQIKPTAQIFKSVESEKNTQMAKPLELTKIAENYTATLNGNESEQEIISGFFETLPLTTAEVAQIEKETKGQSDSRSWKEHRKGRITASNFKDVCTKVDSISRTRGAVKPKTTPLISKLVHGSENIDHVPAIKWGRENESKAFSEFHAKCLVEHDNCKLAKSGLCVLKDKPYIGASPDGTMTCTCCGESGIEIKCPFCIRNMKISEAWEQTDFLEKKDGTIQLKRTHKYYYQITGVMAAKSISKLFFVVWTTKELDVELIEFDSTFWNSNLPKLDVFFKSYMVKVLLGMRIIYFCPKCEKIILEGEEVQENSPDNSVCCDHCGAWFHFGCAQVTDIEDDQEWFCQACLLDFVDGELDSTSLVHY